ncbi:MAG: hypothetical protein Barrevirus6_21 [Barrevirus sp.]|uniref:Uncharacterized protein n=1 Tax=Barrevirus sp. TaxID=2487763 RepID=A0A3G4ZTQ5_9VIRU|nr:MAG: hypothetical protein Barrevirus6_21 [Barrevirus sp.]
MACQFCKKEIQESDNICYSCITDPTKVIYVTDINRKYKLTKVDINSLTHLKFGKLTKLFVLETVWALCETWPDTDKKKKNYQRQKLLIQKNDKVNKDNKSKIGKKVKKIDEDKKNKELREQITNNVLSLFSKYNVEMTDEIFEIFNQLLTSYQNSNIFDVFKISMTISEEMYKHHLFLIEQKKQMIEYEKIKVEQDKRKGEIDELISKKNYKKNHLAYIRSFGPYQSYVINGPDPVKSLSDIVDELQQLLVEQLKIDNRTVLLQKELAKQNLIGWYNNIVCQQYIYYGTITLENVLKVIRKLEDKTQRVQQFMTLAYQFGIYNYNYQSWPLYKEYLLGHIDLNYIKDNMVLIKQKEDRRKQVLSFIKKEFSNRYKRHIRRFALNSKMVKNDFIENNIISFVTCQNMLYLLEENLIDQSTTLSDKWKGFIKRKCRDILTGRASRDVLLDTILFSFCDQDQDRLELTMIDYYMDKGKRNIEYAEGRCKQLELKYVRQVDPIRGMLLIITK